MYSSLFVVGGLVLGQIVFLEQRGDFVGAPEAVIDLSVACLAYCRKLDYSRNVISKSRQKDRDLDGNYTYSFHC